VTHRQAGYFRNLTVLQTKRIIVLERECIKEQEYGTRAPDTISGALTGIILCLVFGDTLQHAPQFVKKNASSTLYRNAQDKITVV